MLFFLSMSLYACLGLYLFWFTEEYGLITKIMFNLIHGYLAWAAFTEFCGLLIMVRVRLCRMWGSG